MNVLVHLYPGMGYYGSPELRAFRLTLIVLNAAIAVFGFGIEFGYGLTPKEATSTVGAEGTSNETLEKADEDVKKLEEEKVALLVGEEK
ncbi:hypothetical protein JCM8547_008932 [Rhodosporidiobolus lusitaniae]